MIVLGMFGPGANSGSCLLVNGKLKALVEEERLSRIKTAPDGLPFLSASKCLEIQNLKISDVNYIAWGWNCFKYQAILKRYNKKLKKFSQNYLANSLNMALYDPQLIKKDLYIYFKKKKLKKFPKIEFLDHHKCHAASAVFCSGFKKTNILTIDGSGEDLCTVVWEFQNNNFKILKKFNLPHSLGAFYGTFTEYLGFRSDMDEGKLMGLAAYGRYSKKLQYKLDKVISFNPKNGEYKFNSKMRYDGKHNYGKKFTDQLVNLFGHPRTKEISALKKNYPDIAFNVQKRLEDIVASLANFAFKKNKIDNFCIAGGVGMNCKMNGELLNLPFVKKLFVQPASSDNGVSLGAAQLLTFHKKVKLKTNLDHVYYGPCYSDIEIKKILKEKKINFTEPKNVNAKLAQLIIKKKIVARFDGRMEFGARSLGNRSIIASPYFKDIREYINLKVKNRENWRPFCPSVLDEDFEKIFEGKHKPKFMGVAIKIKKKFKKIFPACVHEDNTVRVQIVDKKTNYNYWQLLKEIKKKTEYGILINTSFNVQGEPIVCSPLDALRTFYSSGIDCLLMGKYLIEKNDKN
jgi:carbamoyltransferase